MSEVATRPDTGTLADPSAPLEGTVTTDTPDITALQSTNRTKVRRAHLAIVDAERKGDAAEVAKAKTALRVALREGRALSRVTILETADAASKHRSELAEMDAEVKQYAAHTLTTVGLAAFHLSVVEIMRDLFGFEGATETTEGKTLHKRVSRLASRGMTLALARDAKGATLTRAEEVALAAVAPTSVKAAKAQTFTAEEVADLAPKTIVVVSPEDVATKALAKVDGLITRTEDALRNLQSVAADVPSAKFAELAKVAARVEALLTVWTTVPTEDAPEEEDPSEDDLAAIESETA